MSLSLSLSAFIYPFIMIAFCLYLYLYQIYPPTICSFFPVQEVCECVCVWCLLFMYAWLHTQHGTELQLYLAMLNGKNKNMTNKPKYATINHSSLPYSCITIQSLKPLIRAQHCLDIQVWNVLILMVTLWVLCEIVMNHRRSANGLSHL